MFEELKRFLVFVRPAFSRQATYGWFIIVFVGFLLRTDTFGVSSVVRALMLAPACYTSLLHFFHSSAWTVEGLMAIWWTWLRSRDVAYCVNGRLVLLGASALDFVFREDEEVQRAGQRRERGQRLG